MASVEEIEKFPLPKHFVDAIRAVLTTCSVRYVPYILIMRYICQYCRHEWSFFILSKLMLSIPNRQFIKQITYNNYLLPIYRALLRRPF